MSPRDRPGGRPHVLYIAWGYPPSRGSGVYRALATANMLAEGGFDVTVLTCERDTFHRYTGVDPTLESRIDPRIEVVRIPFDLPETDIRRWSRDQARHSRDWRDRRNERILREFPEANYGSWRRPLIGAAEDIHRRRPIDLTVATANPNVAIEAAHVLFERFGIPFVLDQRDAWSLNVFTEERTEDPRVLEREAAYLRDALECWFVNDAISQWHATHYPAAADRIHTVANGYDLEFAPAPHLQPPPPERPLRFGYVGTISSAVPLAELLAGWQLAREQHEELRQAQAQLWGYLGFFLVHDGGTARTLELAEASGVRYCGPKPKTKLAEVYAELDVLLLVLGRGRFVTSGKVYEYMATGLPIVSVHAPGADAEKVLAGYPLWFQADDLEPAAIAVALGAAAGAARTASEQQRLACVEYAARWERSRQLMPRVSALLARFERGS